MNIGDRVRVLKECIRPTAPGWRIDERLVGRAGVIVGKDAQTGRWIVRMDDIDLPRLSKFLEPNCVYLWPEEISAEYSGNTRNITPK